MINTLTIQKALKDAGHYKGELDGDFGKLSRGGERCGMA